MASNPFDKLDADIALLRKRIVEDQTALAELEKAKAVLIKYAVPAIEEKEEDDEPRKTTVADKIEEVLIMQGPLEAAQIFDGIGALGFETTSATVNTNLSRMKSYDRVTNENGKWDLTSKRRKALSK